MLHNTVRRTAKGVQEQIISVRRKRGIKTVSTRLLVVVKSHNNIVGVSVLAVSIQHLLL
jgi:hypothetical protein